MFRPIRRTKNAISDEQAKALLKNEKRGVLAVNGDDGYPFAIPVNFIYDEETERIYIHGAKSGHKVDSIKKNDKICFTVYGNEHFEENDWAPYVQSVVIFGRCNLVSDKAATEKRVRDLGNRYYPDRAEVEEEIKKYLDDVQLYEIVIEHMCGKQIHEK